MTANRIVAAFLALQASISGGILFSTKVLDYGQRHPKQVKKYGRYSPKLYLSTVKELGENFGASFAGPRR